MRCKQSFERQVWWIAMLVMVCFGISPLAQTAANGSYYHIELGKVVAATEPLAVKAMAADSVHAKLLVPAPEGGIIVIASAPFREAGEQELWWIAGDVTVPETVNIPIGDKRILGAAATDTEVFLGTDHGVAKISGAAAELSDMRFILPQISVANVFWGPGGLTSSITGIARDREGNIWLSVRRSLWRGLFFPSDPGEWVHRYQGKELDRAYPRLRVWTSRSTVTTMTGDMSGAGLWAYHNPARSGPQIVYVAPADGLGGLNRLPSVIPKEGEVPALEGPLLVSDTAGCLWLAGKSPAGAKVYRFDGEKIADVSPSAELLQNRSFTQLIVDPADKLYAATDGVGVLVFDGQQWSEHPINEHLPTLENTELKPVDCMVIDKGGSLWVACGPNLIRWQKEEGGSPAAQSGAGRVLATSAIPVQLPGARGADVHL